MELKPATAALVLESNDLVKERVDCPEWGVFLYIRTMSINERTAWEQHLKVEKDKADADGVDKENILENAVADLIARTACYEGGELMFSTDETEALGKRASAPMKRCYDVTARLNYLADDHIDELVKNSEGDQSDGSGSA